MSRPLEHEDLFSLAIPSDPELSRDGTLAVWTVTTADRDGDRWRSAIWLAAADGSEPPRQVTGGEGETTPRLSPDGRTLAFLAARGDGPAQVHLLPLAGGEARKLTTMEHGASSIDWSPDGTRLAVTSLLPPDPPVSDTEPVVVERLDYKADGAGLLRGRRSQLFVVDASDGAAVQVSDDRFSYAGPVWSPDGSALAVTTSVDDRRDIEPSSVVQIIPAVGGDANTVTPRRGIWTVVDWSADGGTLLVAGYSTSPTGLTRLATVAVGGGDPKPVLPDLDRNVMVGAPAYPGGRPRLLSDGVVFCIRDRGATHLVRLVGDTASPTTIVAGDRSVSGLSCAAGRWLAVVSDASTPGEIVVGELDGSGQRRLTALFAAAFPDVELLAPVERNFHAADATIVHGWVLRSPSTTGAAPTLLDVHGGPHNAWGPTFDGIHLYHQVLAAKGWNVLYLNPRGSDGYGEKFWEAARGSWGVTDEQDFHAALDALVADGTADPDRLAVTGYSYGGYMTCWLTANSERFRAAVPGGALVNLVASAGTSDMGTFLGRYEFGALPWEDSQRLLSSSPLTHVGSVDTPTLILHGDADNRCPVSEAEQWFAALRTRCVPVQMVRYPGGSHLFILTGRPSHRVDYGRRLVEWVEKWTA
jgi:dipeptidyl aminopeptidase/acylaminoacyl peptidase